MEKLSIKMYTLKKFENSDTQRIYIDYQELFFSHSCKLFCCKSQFN